MTQLITLNGTQLEETLVSVDAQGRLVVPQPTPVGANELTSKTYVDAQVGTRLTKTQADALYAPLDAIPQFQCRAWAKFQTSASAGALIGGGNIAAVTRLSAGNYRLDFTVPMQDADYAVVGVTSGNSGVVRIVSQLPGSVTVAAMYATNNTNSDGNGPIFVAVFH